MLTRGRAYGASWRCSSGLSLIVRKQNDDGWSCKSEMVWVVSLCSSVNYDVAKMSASRLFPVQLNMSQNLYFIGPPATFS